MPVSEKKMFAIHNSGIGHRASGIGLCPIRSDPIRFDPIRSDPIRSDGI